MSSMFILKIETDATDMVRSSRGLLKYFFRAEEAVRRRFLPLFDHRAAININGTR